MAFHDRRFRQIAGVALRDSWWAPEGLHGGAELSPNQGMSQNAEPKARRPHTPGAGYGVPEDDESLLPWSHVDGRLREAPNYWLVTVSGVGRPHAVPTWGAWVEGIFYTEGGGRKVQNMRANPAVVVHLESGADVVIMEGEAREIRAPERSLFERIDAAYAAKYEYKPSDNLSSPDDVPYPQGGLFAVQPRVIFAWSQFPEDVTRFSFGPA